MSYWIRLGGKTGNTEICVEDLARTIGILSTGKYPGVCSHCGKTGIRYIAHVRQGTADTLARALGNETVNGSALTVSVEEQDALSVAVLEGKEYKQVDVGCVCVAKYFEDCGVDSGLAKRAQDEVTRIMHVLQEVAGLEADSEQSKLDEALAHWHLVAKLRNRLTKIQSIKHWHEPALAEQSAKNEYFALRQKVRDEYEKAAERWKREAHGFSTYFAELRPLTTQDVLKHYNTKLHMAHLKLAAYQRGAQYV